MISVIPYGDAAVLVNFEQRIDRTIQRHVMGLKHALEKLDSITYMIPSYCALTVVFDPGKTNLTTLKECIEATHAGLPETVPEASGRSVEIPVCYDNTFGPDLEDVSRQTGKSRARVIRSHTTCEFYVYMLGFMPGFAYMGDMPADFFCQRKPTPRVQVPAGSVGLAGLQTAIYPFQMPGGWQIIGRTPVCMFNPDDDPPNYLRPGDLVRFRSISPGEYEKILDDRP